MVVGWDRGLTEVVAREVVVGVALEVVAQAALKEASMEEGAEGAAASLEVVMQVAGPVVAVYSVMDSHRTRYPEMISRWW